MSGLNHDAAMRRGAERQTTIQAAQNAIHDYIDNANNIADAMSNTALVVASAVLVNAVGPVGYFPKLDKNQEHELKYQLSQIIQHIREASLDETECRSMLLDLAKTLLESGTSHIPMELALWESKTFREET